jgi:hypothetical protein
LTMVYRLTKVKPQTYQRRGSLRPRTQIRGRLRVALFLVAGPLTTLATRQLRGIMQDQVTLFDQIGDIQLDPPGHNCTGQLCTYCERFDREDTQVLAEIDPAWRIQATIFRKSLAIGGLFSADVLIDAIGKPLGHPNQIGALFRSWNSQGLIQSEGNFVVSTRESNNGRVIRVWRRTA